ncbi:MAG: cation:proton antiporter [Betaproteobacteria bacterium]
MRSGSPKVVGEVIAGIALGPSLLGWLAPGISATLFAADGLVPLNTLSQIGLLLFMFLARRVPDQPHEHHSALGCQASRGGTRLRSEL